MRFTALSDVGVICTDDYDLAEISQGVPFFNIKNDFRSQFGNGVKIRVFDEFGNFCKFIET